MKKTPPVEKNDIVEFEVASIGSEGQGIGRVDGYAVFVPGALAGELVRAMVIKVGSGYGVGRLMEVLRPSPDRVEPRCPAFARCGGCSIQNLSYPAQLAFKHDRVRDSLERIGGFEGIEVAPVVGMDDPWRYRNKGSFPFAEKDGAVCGGFYAPRSHRLVPLADCPIQQTGVMEIMHAVETWARGNSVPVYDEAARQGVLRHCMVRVSSSGALMAVVVTTGRLPNAAELQRLLVAAGATSVIHNINRKDTNVILGDEYVTLYGEPVIREELLGNSFLVGAASFMQVNHVQTRKLYELAAGFAGTGAVVFDVYCGMGAISLLLARSFKRVIGVESVYEAVEDAAASAAANGVKNCEFIAAPAEEALPELIASGLAPDVIVLDPPRKGCMPAVIDAVAASGARRVVYVSCDPGTLARDCRLLADAGYALSAVRPVDMFPHTPHVECVVLMSRVKE